MADPKDLAMAMNMKRRRKKMAKGGETAKTESRPMPDQRHQDAMEIMHNSGDKAPMQDSMTSTPERKQASKGMRTTPIKHPRMAASDIVSSRLRDEEDVLQSSAAVNDGPQRQPPQSDNEMDATKKGPSVPALGMKKMAKGGMINDDVSMSDAEMDMVDHPAGLESDNDMMGDKDAMDDHMVMLAAGGIADAVMNKRSTVDLDMNAEEQPNDYYHQNEDAALKENYDSDMDDVSQPSDSNEHGHEIDSDDHDLVESIRRRLSNRSK